MIELNEYEQYLMSEKIEMHYPGLNYICLWTDPDEYDHGCQEGSLIFKTKEELEEWLNETVKSCPRLDVLVFKGCIEVEAIKEQVTIEYRIKG